MTIGRIAPSTPTTVEDAIAIHRVPASRPHESWTPKPAGASRPRRSGRSLRDEIAPGPYELGRCVGGLLFRTLVASAAEDRTVEAAGRPFPSGFRESLFGERPGSLENQGVEVRFAARAGDRLQGNA